MFGPRLFIGKIDMCRTTQLLTILFFAIFSSTLSAQTEIKIATNDDAIQVSVGDQPFTVYNFKETSKPFLYPVLGPSQIRMTRDFPMKETDGEADDHPHHKSLWIGHQINGLDFWTCREGVRIVVQGQPTIDANSNSITANSNWLDANDNIVCSDTTKWTFGFDDQSRWIDCEFKLIASQGSIVINDTKEGTVAIRTHPDLRLKPDLKRGVKEVFGSATNSQRTTGAAVWGQSASWVLYSGVIDSNPASLLIVDHPSNFRHPTTWHARDYGLIAANPFGLHGFQKMEKGAGEVELASGQSLTLKYRFAFFAKAIDAEDQATKFRNAK